MKFIRKNGRIIPIREKGEKRKPKYGALAVGISGGVASISLAKKVAAKASKAFGRKAGLSALLGTIFAGEAIAAEGFDRFTESLGYSHRKEQNIKNITAGTLGAIGALSALPFGRKLKTLKRMRALKK